MTWQPIANQEYMNRAYLLIQNIYHILSKVELDEGLLNSDQETCSHISGNLSRGTSGAALFLGYYNRYFNSKYTKSLIEKFGIHSIQTLKDPLTPFNLFEGTVGTLWVVDFVTAGESINSNNIENLDNTLVYILRNSLINHYDLISGYIGLGLHFLRRPVTCLTIEGLDTIIRKLKSDAIYSAEGIAWKMQAIHSSKESKTCFPQGYVDMGIAHGMPGVVLFLVKMIRKGVFTADAYELLEGAIQYIKSKANKDITKSYFPCQIGENTSIISSKSGWCYGDVGVTFALYSAAKILRNEELENYAIDILSTIVKEKTKTIGIIDVCLCHGSAGIMHIYNRLYQATMRPALRNQANYWLDYTLDLLDDSKFNKLLAENNKMTWSDEFSFLTGIAGVGLALLAITESIDPKWDQMMILS